MEHSRALAGLDLALKRPTAQTVVVDADWKQFLEVYQLRRPSSFFDEVASPSQVTHETQETALATRLKATAADQRQAILETHVREVAAEILGQPTDKIDIRRGFFLQGMDSLMAVELRRRLERTLGVSLPATLAMDCPRVTDTAAFLLREVIPRIASPSSFR